jgi:hypothetical protein
MTPINIAIPESLTIQKAELQTILAGIATDEAKLAAQRKDIHVALQSITTAIAVLSGQPLPDTKSATTTEMTRKPMSAEARQRIAEGLRKSAQARASAKAAQGATPAPQEPAPAPADALVVSAAEPSAPVVTDAPVVVSAPMSLLTRLRTLRWPIPREDRERPGKGRGRDFNPRSSCCNTVCVTDTGGGRGFPSLPNL